MEIALIKTRMATEMVIEKINQQVNEMVAKQNNNAKRQSII